MSWPKGIKAKGELRKQYHHLIDVAPTVLEATGLPQSRIVNGVVQKPIEGMSMMNSFDDAQAKSARTPVTGTLSINGKQVGAGKLARTIPFFYGVETADVGLDLYSPVTTAYAKGDNKFTGKIKKVTIAVK